MIDINKDVYLKLVCDALNNIEFLHHKAIFAVSCIKKHATGNRLPFMKLKKVEKRVRQYNVTVYNDVYNKINKIYNGLKYHSYDTVAVSYDDLSFVESWVDFEGYYDWVIDDYRKHLQKQYFSITIPSSESIDGYVEGNFCNYEKEDYYEQAKSFNQTEKV